MAWYWHVVTCGVVAAAVAAAVVETFDVKSSDVVAAAVLQYLFAPCHPILFAGSLLVYNMQCLVSVQTAGAVVLWARKARQRAKSPLLVAAAPAEGDPCFIMISRSNEEETAPKRRRSLLDMKN